MKIAILGAMREEIEPILEHFGEYSEEKYARNSFYMGLIFCSLLAWQGLWMRALKSAI